MFASHCTGMETDKGRVGTTSKKTWFISTSTGDVTVGASQTTDQHICILGMLAGNTVSRPHPWLNHMRVTEIPGDTHMQVAETKDFGFDR